MKRRALTAVVICVCVIGCLWFFFTRTSTDNARPSVENLQNEPNVRISKVEMLEYSDDGSLKFRAQASTMKHSQQEDIVTLDDIDLQIALEGGQNWNLAAPTAIIRNAISESELDERPRIDLIGDVRVLKETDQKPTLSLMGRDLMYYPNERMLESQQPVTIRNDLATFKASAFEINLKNNEFHLIGTTNQRVDIEYEPDVAQ